MYSAMKRLISRNFYKTAEEAQNKLDVFYACTRLSDEQYTALTELVVTSHVRGDEKHGQEKRRKGRQVSTMREKIDEGESDSPDGSMVGGQQPRLRSGKPLGA